MLDAKEGLEEYKVPLPTSMVKVNKTEYAFPMLGDDEETDGPQRAVVTLPNKTRLLPLGIMVGKNHLSGANMHSTKGIC